MVNPRQIPNVCLQTESRPSGMAPRTLSVGWVGCSPPRRPRAQSLGDLMGGLKRQSRGGEHPTIRHTAHNTGSKLQLRTRWWRSRWTWSTSLHGYIRSTPSDTEVHVGHQLRTHMGTKLQLDHLCAWPIKSEELEKTFLVNSVLFLCLLNDTR